MPDFPKSLITTDELTYNKICDFHYKLLIELGAFERVHAMLDLKALRTIFLEDLIASREGDEW